MAARDDKPALPPRENEIALRLEFPAPEHAFGRVLAISDWKSFLWQRRNRENA